MSDIIQAFPDYEMVTTSTGQFLKNVYKGIDVGKGGFVYAEPGIYKNVALIDANSMHPTSIICMQYFGEYTKNYEDLLKARIAIKHKDYDLLKTLLDGKLEKYIHDDSILKTLDKVLKYPLNAAYGVTAASFDSPFRDPRNINNIVALRGALFMVDLKEAVEAQGYSVAHIKTDSIKIPNANDDIVKFVQDFAEAYGYKMDYEAMYAKICLVNDAVYIAKYDDKGVRNKGGEHANEWTATGAEFMHHYIFKTLFSHEPITFKDMCEVKSVKSPDAIYLDMNKDLVRKLEAERNDLLYSIANHPKGEKGIMDLKRQLREKDDIIESIHNLKFVGKCGSFVPVDDSVEGGYLVRSMRKDGVVSYNSVSGTKGYRWLESEDVKKRGLEKHLDMNYYRGIVDAAYKHISKFGDPDEFING